MFKNWLKKYHFLKITFLEVAFQLFVYNSSCLYTLFELFVYFYELFVYFLLTVCLHFQLFIYIFSCLFTFSAVCLQPFLIMCKINFSAKIQMSKQDLFFHCLEVLRSF